MSDSIKKFEELLKTDPVVQEKLKAAAESYNGASDDAKANFEAVLLPIAKEYGVEATFEEFEVYMNTLYEDQMDLSPEELETVAGGKNTYGAGFQLCIKVGVGLGGEGGGDGPDSGCIAIGGGGTGMCAGIGDTCG